MDDIFFGRFIQKSTGFSIFMHKKKDPPSRAGLLNVVKRNIALFHHDLALEIASVADNLHIVEASAEIGDIDRHTLYCALT